MKKNWGGPSGALNRLQSHYFRALLKKLLEVIVHAPLAYLEFRYRIHYLFKCLKIVILLVREEVYFVGPCDLRVVGTKCAADAACLGEDFVRADKCGINSSKPT